MQVESNPWRREVKSGRVKWNPREYIQRNVRLVRATGCWEWQKARTPQGYGHISVNGKGMGSHRFSYEAFVGPVPDKVWVLHRCDNRRCVNPEHLFLGTSSDNMKDARDKGRLTMPGSKVTEKDVIEIRRRSAAGERQAVLAADYGLTRDSVSKIVVRRSWVNVE